MFAGFVRTKRYDALAGVLLAVTGCEALFAKWDIVSFFLVPLLIGGSFPALGSSIVSRFRYIVHPLAGMPLIDTSLALLRMLRISLPRSFIPWPRCSAYRRRPRRRGHRQYILLDYPRENRWTPLLVRIRRRNCYPAPTHAYLTQDCVHLRDSCDSEPFPCCTD